MYHYLRDTLYIIDLITEKRITRRDWQRTRNPELKRKLNKLTHTVSNELEAHRIHNYENLIKTMDTKDPGMWKTTRRILRKHEDIPSLIVDGNNINTDEDKVNAFANYLENIFRPDIIENVQFATIILQFNENNLIISFSLEERVDVDEMNVIIVTLPTTQRGQDTILYQTL